ncbi:MAG: GTP 3',8-cyclase MoaA [Eubacteriales bacterium]|nr:GTP 3',8-cyclase MoaA [Eubacteriales bacterium]
MKDLQGRTIDYMRISITDRCNLRCKYCMPEGIRLIPMEELLTYEEILEVCLQAAALGIRKFKITGGEPLVRKGCANLVRNMKRLSGIEQVTMTTNGVLLEENLKALLEAGLDGLNISLDTLDRKKYEAITGFDRMDAVLSAIDRAMDSGIRVKINTVLQPGVNDGEWNNLLELARDRALDVRFIEMMPIGYGKECGMVSGEELLGKVKEVYAGVEKDERVHGNGPAAYYRIPGFRGSVGFISAIHGRFCDSCNRIRMTATGDLKPCLCYQDAISVRSALREGSGDEVRDVIKRAILMKPKMHCFEQMQNVTEHKKMVQIGG